MFEEIQTKKELIKFLEKHQDENSEYSKALEFYKYNQELRQLQAEMLNLQKWVQKEKKKIAVIFEGRDAAGKGGSIKRFKEHLNPRAMRVVALNKPTEVERNQWYFNRYIKELPNAGEIVFFDRSWYNRAVVEPVMGFCNDDQYNRFMRQVPDFEHMLYESGTIIIKFWFSVSKNEQLKRFQKRLKSPLKRWKYSPVDEKGQELWDKYTYYKDQMFARTHHSFCPWVIVKSDNKKIARLESMKYVLSQFNYDGKEDTKTNLLTDPNIVHRYFSSAVQLDK